MAIVEYHNVMIIICKPHGPGATLIGMIGFRNATSTSPRNRSMCTRPFPTFGVGSGDKTSLYCELIMHAGL